MTEEVFGVDLVHLQLELAQGRLLAELGFSSQNGRGAARFRRPGPGQHGEDGRRRRGVADRRRPHRLRAPQRTGAAHGHVRLRRLPDESTLRLPAGQGPWGECHRPTTAPPWPGPPGRSATSGSRASRRTLPSCARCSRAQRPDRGTSTPASSTSGSRNSSRRQQGSRIRAAGPVRPDGGRRGLAGVKVDAVDPLAVLDHGKSGGPAVSVPAAAPPPIDSTPVPEGLTAVRAPMQGTVLSHEAEPGQEIAPGQILFIMEAMKMEHEIRSDIGGVLRDLRAAIGDAVWAGPRPGADRGTRRRGLERRAGGRDRPRRDPSPISPKSSSATG